MNNDSPLKAILVVTITALVCSVLVTVTVVLLKPIKQAYQHLERNQAIVQVSGLAEDTKKLTDKEIVNLYQQLEPRIVDLRTGQYDKQYNPDTFDTFAAANDSQFNVTIPNQYDIAQLGSRSQLITVYLVEEGGQLQRMLLPISGQGMWAKIYGYIALQADLNTIADITFYEQTETAGIGDQILDPGWQASWQGKQIYAAGKLMFASDGSEPGKNELIDKHQIDAISGATVTVDAVKNTVRYWFGEHGYARFLELQRTSEEGS